jgi:hypothetical protein
MGTVAAPKRGAAGDGREQAQLVGTGVGNLAEARTRAKEDGGIPHGPNAQQQHRIISAHSQLSDLSNIFSFVALQHLDVGGVGVFWRVIVGHAGLPPATRRGPKGTTKLKEERKQTGPVMAPWGEGKRNNAREVEARLVKSKFGSCSRSSAREVEAPLTKSKLGS